MKSDKLVTTVQYSMMELPQYRHLMALPDRIRLNSKFKEQNYFCYWPYGWCTVISLQRAFTRLTLLHVLSLRRCCSMCYIDSRRAVFLIMVSAFLYFQCGTRYLRWSGEFAPKCEREEAPAREWEAPFVLRFPGKAVRFLKGTGMCGKRTLVKCTAPH